MERNNGLLQTYFTRARFYKIKYEENIIKKIWVQSTIEGERDHRVQYFFMQKKKRNEEKETLIIKPLFWYNMEDFFLYY